MTRWKDIDYSILFELMRNAKVSDRQLSKQLGVSQPTVTRRRAKLEKELLDGYTAVPKWAELGYRVMAITLVKIKAGLTTKEEYLAVRERGLKWLEGQPEVVMAGACQGTGVDSVMISVHKTYGDYDQFTRSIRLEMGDLITDVQSILVNLAGNEVLRPLHFKYLADAENSP